MTAPPYPDNDARTPHYKVAGVLLTALAAAVVVLVGLQYRGAFADTRTLTLIAGRAGLSMDPGSKVTFNGVEVGRVTDITAVDQDGVTKARVTLGVDDRYLHLIPRNVDAHIKASTIFGNKYVAFASPKDPSPTRITPSDTVDVSAVTTEVDTLFQTVVDVTEKVDPVKLNQTLTATAQALDGLGERFGHSLADADTVLADVNPRITRLQRDVRGLADLADVYASASPELFDGLRHTVITAATLHDEQTTVDETLMSAVGFGTTTAPVVQTATPYLVRGAADLVPTSALLDEYSPELFCTIRNFHDVEPKIAASAGGNGYSVVTRSEILGAGNPYVYPDNLPRINAHGGPEGRPGCWQPVTRDLWPQPYLVMDTGASIAPYNHIGLGQPLATDYVWGRQIGQNTINP